jgi:mRNA interferase YafQ
LLNVNYRNVFRKDVKRAKRRGKDLRKLKHVTEIIISNKLLPRECQNHLLIGNYSKHYKCHIEPDWLLIYKIEATTVIFERTGSHSDLFK